MHPASLRSLSFVLLITAALVGPREGAAQERARLDLTISAEGGGPLEGVQVSARGLDLRAVSDTAGRVSVTAIPPGGYIFEMSRLGYAPKRVALEFKPGETVKAEVALAERPLMAEELEVTAKRRVSSLARSGFYERQRVGIGKFLTREELQKRSPYTTSVALRGVPGIRIAPVNPKQPRAYVAMSSRSPYSCPLPVYVDGMLVPDIVLLEGGIDDVISLNQIEAVEVYNGPANTPPQFISPTRRANACGALVIWTRMAP